MAGNYTWLSGKVGYVVLDMGDDGLQEFPCTDWSVAIHAEFLKRNVFRSDGNQGYQDGVSGFKSGKITFKMPWAYGLAPIHAGVTYTGYFGITADGPLEYTATFHVTDLTPGDNAEDGPTIDVSGDTVGSFDIATIEATAA